jgi:sortase B
LSRGGIDLPSPRSVLRTAIGIAIIIILAYLFFDYLGDKELEDEAASVRSAAQETLDAFGGETGWRLNPAILELRRQLGNDDIIGHLVVEGTGIDYVVAQAQDNEFYLTHDINKEESIAGWIFLDSWNQLDKFEKNTVIYGHNMRNPIMFHDLREFREPEFFFENRRVTFDSLYETGSYEIFAFYESSVSFQYHAISFGSDQEFLDLVKQMLEKSWYMTEVEIKPSDRILTLSTCASASGDNRLVLHAVKTG